MFNQLNPVLSICIHLLFSIMVFFEPIRYIIDLFLKASNKINKTVLAGSSKQLIMSIISYTGVKLLQMIKKSKFILMIFAVLRIIEGLYFQSL